MKKAVISTGGKQYIVSKDEVIDVERLNSDNKSLTLKPLMVIDGENISLGTPTLEDITVTAEIVEDIKGDKVVSIRYKAKKRVRKVQGHRQSLTKIKIKDIK